LLEDIVPAGLTLLALHKKVVGRRDLVMLVVLDEGRRLFQVVALEVVFE
jgi:hypothetical protein